MKFDPQRHHRRSIRFKGYDYTQPGAYFTTLVTREREHLLGEIKDGKLFLSFPGKIVRECWRAIPIHFPNTLLDEFVIMPNHLHGIIFILDQTGEAPDAKPIMFSKHLNKADISGFDYKNKSGASPQLKGTNPGSLGSIIQNFKSVSTRKINKKYDSPGNKIWQRDYYDRVIRNQRELEAIRQYILYNPLKWEEDSHYL